MLPFWLHFVHVKFGLLRTDDMHVASQKSFLGGASQDLVTWGLRGERMAQIHHALHELLYQLVTTKLFNSFITTGVLGYVQDPEQTETELNAFAQVSLLSLLMSRSNPWSQRSL